MKKWCCTTCGGTHVYSDAWVPLNDEDDIMEFDDKHCEDCEGECRVEEREVPDDD